MPEPRKDPLEEKFTNIDPSTLHDDLQPFYKSMQADYTRKTQDVAELRKQAEGVVDENKKLTEQIGALKEANIRWQQWYDELEEEKRQDAENQKKKADDDFHNLPKNSDVGDDEKIAKIIENYDAKIESLVNEITSLKQSKSDDVQKFERMFSYHAQLNELARKDPDLEREKLLAFAAERGYTNLEDAYKAMYSDKLMEVEVQKRVDQKLKEMRTDGVHSTATRKILETPKTEDGKRPSFSGATENIVKELASEGKL